MQTKLIAKLALSVLLLPLMASGQAPRDPKATAFQAVDRNKDEIQNQEMPS